jgi:hypothetical protein
MMLRADGFYCSNAAAAHSRRVFIAKMTILLSTVAIKLKNSSTVSTLGNANRILSLIMTK